MTYQRSEDLVFREIAGETLLVPLREQVADMQHIFALNPVATHVWNALDGNTPVGQLVDSVCDVYDVGPDRAREDVTAFILELIEARLVKEL